MTYYDRYSGQWYPANTTSTMYRTVHTDNPGYDRVRVKVEPPTFHLFSDGGRLNETLLEIADRLDPIDARNIRLGAFEIDRLANQLKSASDKIERLEKHIIDISDGWENLVSELEEDLDNVHASRSDALLMLAMADDSIDDVVRHLRFLRTALEHKHWPETEQDDES